ncbi:MAG: chitobiase/beta-hexosaminidase C-terminal domain-containing protein [Verrucomicrobiae bacterium]|nr:chitobiase/beta-hexosaminidase C-terminal domain-containing protein [Verrucomicrobiae bacterium]
MLSGAAQRNISVSLTVNTVMADEPALSRVGATFNIGRIKNIYNQPAGRLDYLRSKTYQGCARSPGYREVWIKHVRFLINANPGVVRNIQMDDVDMNISYLSNGGCFCDHCNTGFRQYLASKFTTAQLSAQGVSSVSTFSYRDYLRSRGQDPVKFISTGSGVLKDAYVAFQTQNTVDFYRHVHHATTNYFKRPIGFAANTRSSPRVIEDLHDLFIREYTSTDPGSIYDTFVTQAARGGKPLALTYDSSYSPADHRRFAASCYAAGGHGLVPWDVYIIPEDYLSPSRGRFFGTVQDFAPIYGFVKAMSRYLDGYEDAGLFQTVRADSRYQAQPVYVENNPSASLFVRATGRAQDPVVIHIIRKDPANTAPFTISLNPDSFFGTPMKKTLYTMPAYNATTHITARSTGNYSTLAVNSTTSAMADPRLMQVQLPSFSLWGTLVLEPVAGALVQPTIVTRREMIEPQQQVRIVNSGKGVIRYTLDGSEPGPASTLYSGPFTITRGGTIKARAFLGSESTPTSSASVRVIRYFDIAKSPNTKLWLQPATDLRGLAHNAPVAAWTPTIGPVLRAPATLLPTLNANTPPIYRTNALNGAPGVYFNGTNCISVGRLMNEVGIPRSFTVVMISQSEDSDFGMCGNGGNGGGGIPRFYFTRGQFSYGERETYLGMTSGSSVEMTTVRMNTAGKIEVFKNGSVVGTGNASLVTAFAGGAFAVPWGKGNKVPAGTLGEVIVFNRALTDEELESVHLVRQARLASGAPPVVSPPPPNTPPPVIVDPPVVTAPQSTTASAPFSVRLTVDRNFGYWSTNGSPYAAFSTAGTNLWIGSTTTLSFYGRDAAGNAGPIRTRVYTIDATPPGSTSVIDIEAERFSSLSAPFQLNTTVDPDASEGRYLFAPPGQLSVQAPPSTGHARYNFSVPGAGRYRVRARVRAPTMNSDSFWIRMDSGAWLSWNGFYGTTPALAESFRWVTVSPPGSPTVVEYVLAAGAHTLTVAYREPYTFLDRIQIVPSTAVGASVTLMGPESLIPASGLLEGLDRQIQHSILRIGEAEYLTMTFVEPDPLPPGVVYRPVVGSDLTRWSADGIVPVSQTDYWGQRTITVRDREPVRDGIGRFLRLDLLTEDESSPPVAQ